MKNTFEVENLEQFLSDAGAIYHHSATVCGYVSRKKTTSTLEPYNGKFGRGFKLYLPLYNTTRYCRVQYYISEKKG